MADASVIRIGTVLQARRNYSPRSHLTAILTAVAADLYEQRRPKTDEDRGLRARDRPEKTQANEPGRFSPPA